MKGKTMLLNVKVSRVQAVTIAGNSLRFVKLDGERLIVKKKRLRGSQIDTHYYPLSKVLAYAEGEGGKDGTAYATVIQECLLRYVSGEGVVLDGWVRVLDEDGVAHNVNMLCDAVVSVVEPQEVAEEQPRMNKIPKIPVKSTEARVRIGNGRT